MVDRIINIILIIVMLGYLVEALGTSRASAQGSPEIAPYKFAQLPLNGPSLFKTVHEGCELYIVASNMYVQDPKVSITTGRGCK